MGSRPPDAKRHFEGKGDTPFLSFQFLSVVSCAKTAELIEMRLGCVLGGPKEPCVRRDPDPHTWRGNFKGEKGLAYDMPGHVWGRYTQSDLARSGTGAVQMICIIWSSWCHCHHVICCFIKNQNGLTWCRLIQVVLEEAFKRVTVDVCLYL